MPNLIDYIKWRGDLSFKTHKFNEIDMLVLCQISYLNFDELAPAELKAGMTLSALWNAFRSEPDFEKRADLGVMINPQTVDVFELAAKSERFENVRIAGYVNKIDIEREEQFSAMTYFTEKERKNPYVVFRGTDDTIVGWKEDFNMALSTDIPAQLDSIEYINNVAKLCRGKICTAGHSKGGNLAVYAACFMNDSYKKRLSVVYNFDGPGFTSKVRSTSAFDAVRSRIKSWYPYESIIGMLFEHDDGYTVIESSQKGVWQHDALSWQIEGRYFVTKPELDSKSIYFNRTFNTWLSKLPEQKLEKVIDAIFDVLAVTGARTNSELESDFFGNTRKIIKAIGSLDNDVRTEAGEFVKLLLDSALSGRK